ncbi:uncharacterized protein LOC114841315 [Diachasma alloeum]|uniref:uncharacterized protein LOC114841315 n=1 Tax=Diachasma alloeum TaxID=454923 RepID=UPI0010FAFAE3|nr:uncharacterized protein LOC114841315 [Diachasma alloeum]
MDVVMFQETHLETKGMAKMMDRLNKQFEWFGKEAIRIHRRGKASGGFLMGIRRTLEADWKVEEWKYGLRMSIKAKGSRDGYVVINTYNNDRKNLKKVLKEMDGMLEDLEGSEERLIVTGDLNARIGELQGISECGTEERTGIKERRSQDKTTRDEGRKLVDWCEERALLIQNGRAEGDEEGQLTFIGEGAGLGSVLDYIIVRLEEEEAPGWFRSMEIAEQEAKGSRDGYVVINSYNNDRKNLKQVLKEMDGMLEDLEGSEERLIVTGDLNARIGELQGISECGTEERTGIKERRSQDKTTRDEGRKLVDWCEERALLIQNGRAEGDEEGQLTFIGEGAGLGSVLDYIIVRLEEEEAPGWFRSMEIAEQEGSDHLPIILKVDWSERTKRGEEGRENREPRLKWRETREETFQEKWEKRWTDRIEEVENTEERWARLVKITTEAAHEAKMVTGNKKKEGAAWDTGEYQEERRKMFRSLNRFRRRRDWNSKRRYNEHKRSLRKIRGRLIAEWIEEKQRAVAASKTMGEWWKAMNWFRQGRKKEVNMVSEEEWVNHFKSLLEAEKKQGERAEEETVGQDREERETQKDGRNDAREEEERDLKLNEDLIDWEILGVINGLKTGKAAGEDGITAEFWKNLPEEGREELIEIIKELWRREEMIDRWRLATIFPIHKRGDINTAANYRGVSLLDIGYKILSSIMARRLGKWLEEEEKLSEAQAGFRRRRGTMEQEFVLNTLIGNRLKKKGGKLYVAFIDFKAEFDKVDRRKLWNKMEEIGIVGKFLRMSQRIYEGTRNRVIVGTGLTEEFQTGKGVRQGCPLSPILFNIFIQDLIEAMEKRGDGGTPIGPGAGVKIFTLMYADDAAIVAEEGSELKRMLKTLEKWADGNEMEVSVEKTKIMVFRNGGRRRKESWEYKGKKLEVVNEFKYLGFWFTTKNTYSRHAKKLTGKAQTLVNKTWGEMRRGKIRGLRKRLYFMGVTVKAAALYGVELWGWRRQENIERIKKKYTKASMGLARNTPDYIWRMEAGVSSVEVEAVRRAAAFLIKLSRMEESRWPRKCLKEELRGIKNGQPSSWGKEVHRGENRKTEIL